MKINHIDFQQTHGMAIGLEFDVNEEKEFCGTCAENKNTRKTFKGKGTDKGKTYLDIVHSDVCSPMAQEDTGFMDTGILLLLLMTILILLYICLFDQI